MAHMVAIFASLFVAAIGSYALAFDKRTHSDDIFDSYVYGVEVNGLFNPMESLSPQLFERASEEQGNTLISYNDICKLVPQENLDALMWDHFITFISDYDLSVLKSSGINTLRIPVTYNMFLRDVNRTENFPNGERRALDLFIERVLEYDMKIWLDLMADHNNHLGQLEEYGSVVTHERATYVVQEIAEKYDPRDITAVMVHPDVTFPTSPAGRTPLDPKTVKATRHSQYKLLNHLAVILGGKGHILAIDTSENLAWWANIVNFFPSSVVLVHSLKTGLLSQHQHSVPRLLSGIRDDVRRLSEMAEKVPVVVTWDASLNACLEVSSTTHDCSIAGQLWEAMGRDPGRKDPEHALNRLTETMFSEILGELDNASIAGWFFRTAKVQVPNSNVEGHRSKNVSKRGNADRLISGNDYLSLQENGMIPTYRTKKSKNLLLPAILGLGAAGGAGFLGWCYWDDIKALGKRIIQFFRRPPRLKLEAVRQSQQDGLSHVKSRHSSPPEIENQAVVPWKDGRPGCRPQQPSGTLRERPTPVLEGSPDKVSTRPVSELIERFEAPHREPKSRSQAGSISGSSHIFVSELVSRIESHRNSVAVPGDSGVSSPGTSCVWQPLNVDLARELLSGQGSEQVRPPLSEIRGKLEKNGIQSEAWERTRAVPRPSRPNSRLDNVGSKRQGKVVSKEEQELLGDMLQGRGTGPKEGLMVNLPDTYQDRKVVNPEPLTHIQQEQYTRPHLGSGYVPHSGKGLGDAPEDRPINHHIIESGKVRPMTVHAPRIKDMDPNYPKNLKKMEPQREKYDKYKPYPPAKVPEVPPSGVGKDPRPNFEDQNWTAEERARHTKMPRSPQPEQVEDPGMGRVKKAKGFWDSGRGITQYTGTPQVREPKKVAGLGTGRVKKAKEFWDNPEEKAKSSESPPPKMEGWRSGRVTNSKGFGDEKVANQLKVPEQNAHSFPEIENIHNALARQNTGVEGENAPTEEA